MAAAKRETAAANAKGRVNEWPCFPRLEDGLAADFAGCSSARDAGKEGRAWEFLKALFNERFLLAFM
jgi:hypothetical protein